MTEVNLKTLTPDTSINDDAVLFGADSQSASLPSVYSVATLKSHIRGNNVASFAIGYAIDNAGEVLTTGAVGNGLRVPAACEITSVTLIADQAGDVVVDIWKDSLANFPPTNDDSICASAKPTLSAARTASDSTLTGWTKSLAAGDILFFEVESCSAITSLTIILGVTKA
jgi:hypothetical protein